MSCGCSRGAKCGCGCMKDISCNSKDIIMDCCCCNMSHKDIHDMCHNYVHDMCHNYVHDMCHNYVHDISCNWNKDISYNVTSSYCKNCNKILTNSIKLNNEVCDCSYNYLIYTGDISNAEIELELEISIGPTGPTGPTGPSGLNSYMRSKTYLSIYSTKEQYIVVDEAIQFEENTALNGHCMHVPGTTEIYLWKPGYYVVNLSVYTLEPCQFSIIKNMLYIVKGSTIGSISGSSQNTHTYIMCITEDDIINEYSKSPTNKACVLCIVNSSSISRGVNLYGSNTTGTPIPQITASFTLMCIE